MAKRMRREGSGTGTGTLAKRMRREGSGTGTGTRESPRLSSLLFLLSEERYRQPRAVYKHWACGLPSCDHAAYKF